MLVLTALLTSDMSVVYACSLLPTPTGVLSPTPTLNERLNTATQNADLILEGRVIDIRDDAVGEIIVVEVEHYLKGQGTEIVRLRPQPNPCLYNFMDMGTQGIFFAQGLTIDNMPFQQIEYFEPAPETLNQVSETVGQEPYTPPRNPSLAALTTLALAGVAATGWLIGRKRSTQK